MSRLSRWLRARREPLNILKRGLGAKLGLTSAPELLRTAIEHAINGDVPRG